MNSEKWLEKGRYGTVVGLSLLLFGMLVFIFSPTGETLMKKWKANQKDV